MVFVPFPAMMELSTRNDSEVVRSGINPGRVGGASQGSARRIVLAWNVKPMADRINTVPAKRPETETPTVVNDNTNSSETSEKKMEKVADKAAHKAAKTQQEFDEGHTTFSNI